MNAQRRVEWAVGGLTAVAGVAAAAYAAYAGTNWLRYGHPAPPAPDESDAFLDRLMPEHDVVERPHVRVNVTGRWCRPASC